MPTGASLKPVPNKDNPTDRQTNMLNPKGNIQKGIPKEGAGVEGENDR